MEDDVASMKWGSSWRIPTKDEFEELWSLPHRWEIVNGIQGMKFTSSNGHSIFLPAAGAKKYKELKEEGGWAYIGLQKCSVQIMTHLIVELLGF